MKGLSLLILFLALLFTTLPVSSRPVQTETITYPCIYGRVIDGAAGQPLVNATIIIWNIERGALYVKTNPLGDYEVEVGGWSSYRVYAYCNRPSTPGFDYIPAYRYVSIEGGSLNVSFTLLPSASLFVTGSINLPYYPSMRRVVFTVTDRYGLLNGTDAVTKYGEPFLLNSLLNLSKEGIVVPSGMPVKVRADIQLADGSELSLTIDDRGDYLNLTQGALLTLPLQNFTLRSFADTLQTRLQIVQAYLGDTEKMGAYVSYERIRLFRAENLLESAYSALAQGDYDSAYADLHEAQLILMDTMGTLSSLLVNASYSVFFITPFLGFTAVAVASVLFEGRRKRLVLSLALYGAVFGLLYLLYPGYSALRMPAYNPWAATALGAFTMPLLVVVSFLVPLFLIQGLPRVYGERTSMERLRLMSAVAAVFSLAARNMKRRRLRTILTVTFMTTSVFAFIVLTSLSFEYGFSVESLSGQAPSEGFLVRKPLVGESAPFNPIEPSILQWLQQRPDAVLVAPKLENTPLVVSEPSPPPLGVLYAPESNMNFSFSGVLGVYPSLEAQVTKMDTIITQGRFLNDKDLNGILISQEAAEKLQVGVNDTVKLFDQAFNVTGIFGSKGLGGLRDLDGMPLIPQYVFMEVLEGVPGPPIYVPYYVPSEWVVIIHGEKAKSLPNMVISRVDVQTQDPNDIMALARQAVLIWPDFEAFASVAGGINRLFIGSYSVAKGFVEGTVPLALVVMNVGLMMLSAVYERRREAVVMSTVGLNPSHISAVFVAEALTLGFVAGSLGYLLGLISYRPMAALAVPFGLKQKVEAIWGILALSFSIAAAVLGSALPAAKASLIATPSLIRRWKIRIEEKPKRPGEPWLIAMPIQIQKGEVEKFFSFMKRRLREYAAYPYSWIDNLKALGEGAATRLTFTYTYTMERSIVTENELFPVESLPDRYTVKLASRTRRGSTASVDEADVRQTANFIRQLLLQYSAVTTQR